MAQGHLHRIISCSRKTILGPPGQTYLATSSCQRPTFANLKGRYNRLTKYHDFSNQTLKHRTNLCGAFLFCQVKLLLDLQQNTGRFMPGYFLGFLKHDQVISILLAEHARIRDRCCIAGIRSCLRSCLGSVRS